MKRELQRLMRDAGVELSWRRVEDLSAADSLPSLVVVTFHGSCQMTTVAPPPPDAPVALGYSHISNGNLMPFAEVECNRIRSELRSTHTSLGPAVDLLLGRALGRVRAHELHHIIDQTRDHGPQGITQKSLSANDLIADRI
jgi:hypothetical protein